VAAKRLAPALLIIALLCGASAAAVADRPVNVLMPQISFTFNAHIAPVKLPKGQRTGVRASFVSKVRTADGSHPPASAELLLELDKNIAIDPTGLPACPSPLLKEDGVQGAELDCKDALVGVGQAEFEVAFPEQDPSSVSSDVLAFNAGGTEGKAKLLLHAYLSSPVSAAVVIPVEVSWVGRGRFGLQAVAKVPKIAGGYGSITKLSLHLGRKFTYKGKQQSYLLAKCPDGHLQAKGVEVFSDGSRLSGSVVRDCIPQTETPGQVG
jgi:hypothetical protein